MSQVIPINVGVPQGSRLSCNAFNGIQDAVLKRMSYILCQTVKNRDLSQSYQQIQNMNQFLAFADDNLITTQNLFDLKKAVDGFSIEIQKIGIQLNPLKCKMII